jgi:hypothetical protein
MSLFPAEANFRIWKGATFSTRINYFRDAGRSQPFDLSGYTAELVLAKTAGGPTLHILSTEVGGITLGGVNGTIDLLIPAATTAAFTWKSAVYDLTVASPIGVVDALLTGRFSASGI